MHDCCLQRLLIHLFVGCESSLHLTLPHAGCKDIVSTCAAVLSTVKRLSNLPLLWSIVLCVLKRKSHPKWWVNSSCFWYFWFVAVIITEPCQIPACLTLYCFQYCLYSSTHKQHDLVYHSRFTCSRHCWAFHWWLHTTAIPLQMHNKYTGIKKVISNCCDVLKQFNLVPWFVDWKQF